MDFQQLLAKMQELDTPNTIAPEVQTSEECGMPPPGMPPVGDMGKPDTPPPSMSVNLNAQGLDNIEDMMKLFQKVNPDMMAPKEPMPSLSMEPSIAAIKPSLPPLKMLPDFDADNDEMPGGEKDHMEPDADNFGGPSDNDADNMPIKGLDLDKDDSDAEKKKEAYANEPDEEEGDVADITDTGDDLHRKKMMFKAPAGGDNAMAVESTDLRSQIRAELLRRLAEAKGAK